ncbi:MAG: M14 family zinc carboxypeptidase [bacterium]|nr:M14 family zinc carboxypeptidase [bacterium]
MPSLASTALGVLGLVGAAVAQSAAPGYLYELSNPTPGQHVLLRQHFDVLGNCCGSSSLTSRNLQIVIAKEDRAALLAIAPTAKLIDVGRPFHEVRRKRAKAAGLDAPDPGYYTVAETEAEIDALVAAYPTLAAKVNLSTLPGGSLTHENRPIWALKVSDNATVDEDEPAIVIASLHHARELNTGVVVIGGMQRTLANYATDPAVQAAVDEHEIYFVPLVNPDGVHHVWNVYDFWRKNRRNNGSNYGVDLNRNFPFLWGGCGSSTNTNSNIYRGPSPGSEPETQTMRNLIERLRPEIYLDYHSYGQEVLRTYAPCATVSPTISTLLEHYVDDLRTPMNYAKRSPSASGEAPEDHWASGGALSFLTETGTSFQPAIATAQAEEARVWPGMRRAVTAWKPAVRGHVRSSLGNAPLVSTITYTPNQFSHGEVTKSRARDGRYGLWLPLGSWSVTFAAAGHTSATVPVTVTNYDAPMTVEVVLDPSGAPALLSRSGAGNIGTNINFTYTSPGDAGKLALFGWSLGTTPGLDLGGQRVIPLNPDFLFNAALSGNSFLTPTWVGLDASGQSQSTLSIPNQAWLIGFTSHVAGITFDPAYHFGVKTWSNAIAVTPIP